MKSFVEQCWEVLKEYQQRRWISSLADRADVTPKTIHNLLCRQHKNPGSETLEALMTAAGRKVMVLTGEEAQILESLRGDASLKSALLELIG